MFQGQDGQQRASAAINVSGSLIEAETGSRSGMGMGKERKWWWKEIRDKKRRKTEISTLAGPILAAGGEQGPSGAQTFLGTHGG